MLCSIIASPDAQNLLFDIYHRILKTIRDCLVKPIGYEAAISDVRYNMLYSESHSLCVPQKMSARRRQRQDEESNESVHEGTHVSESAGLSLILLKIILTFAFIQGPIFSNSPEQLTK